MLKRPNKNVKVTTEKQAMDYIKRLLLFSPVQFDTLEEYVHHFKRRYCRIFNRIPPSGLVDLVNLMKKF